MSGHQRYAIYYLPPADSALAKFGAAWLGWDVDRAVALESRAPDLTETPRKYGFHGTLKPPFRLVDGRDRAGLEAGVEALAADMAPVLLEGMALSRLGRFFALTPVGDVAALGALAAACVRELDGFRAPASEAELSRRRAKGLSPTQDAHLLAWGYPYVMDQFRFHLTLTGRVPREALAEAQARIEAALPDLPEPFDITEIALVGERPDGRFETLQRYALGGAG